MTMKKFREEYKYTDLRCPESLYAIHIYFSLENPLSIRISEEPEKNNRRLISFEIQRIEGNGFISKVDEEIVFSYVGMKHDPLYKILYDRMFKEYPLTLMPLTLWIIIKGDNKEYECKLKYALEISQIPRQNKLFDLHKKYDYKIKALASNFREIKMVKHLKIDEKIQYCEECLFCTWKNPDLCDKGWYCTHLDVGDNDLILCKDDYDNNSKEYKHVFIPEWCPLKDIPYDIGVDFSNQPDETKEVTYTVDGDKIKFNETYSDFMKEPIVMLIDEDELTRLIKKDSFDGPIKGSKINFEMFQFNDKEFTFTNLGIPRIKNCESIPLVDLRNFFANSSTSKEQYLLYLYEWKTKESLKERVTGKLFTNIKLKSYGNVLIGYKDRYTKEPLWVFENISLSFDAIRDFDKRVYNNVFYFKEVNAAVLEKGRYEIEKHRIYLREIKIGCDLHLEYSKNAPHFLDYCSAKVTLVEEKNSYNIKPNEILFLSDIDSIYARGIKE